MAYFQKRVKDETFVYFRSDSRRDRLGVRKTRDTRVVHHWVTRNKINRMLLASFQRRCFQESGVTAPSTSVVKAATICLWQAKNIEFGPQWPRRMKSLPPPAWIELIYLFFFSLFFLASFSEIFFFFFFSLAYFLF